MGGDAGEKFSAVRLVILVVESRNTLVVSS